MSIPVKRIQRYQIVGDTTSPLLHYLIRAPGHTRVFTIDDVAAETEVIGEKSTYALP